MAIVRKEDSTNVSASKKQIIKVNPYENPENVMELMAKICSAQPSADTDLFWKPISEAFDVKIKGKSLGEYLDENRKNLWNIDFRQELVGNCREISWSLEERQNTEHTQIVVAGGFSSGKSSFLNRLTKCDNLLPTGVEPVSVVKTYLYCSPKKQNVEVKGVNQKNVMVTLDTGVLQAIQHSNSSNIYLASILEKLFVEIPSDELDGLAFIDTPGYNNSDKVNECNGKTDNDTAMEALSEGNVLFWMIDCEKGTTVAQDIERIKSFDGPKVIIFNKADKKGVAESKNIVDNACYTLEKYGITNIIDIIAYSTLDEKIYYSNKGYTSLSQMVAEVKKTGNGVSEQNRLRQNVIDLFDQEIMVSRNTIRSLQERLQEQIDAKDKYYKNFQEDKEANVSFIKSLKEIIIDGYNEVNDAAHQAYNLAWTARNKWIDFHNWISNIYNNGFRASTISEIGNALNFSFNNSSNIDRSLNSFDWGSWNEEYRKERCEVVKQELDRLNGMYKQWYDEASSDCDETKKEIAAENEIIKSITCYKNLIVYAIDEGVRQYRQRNIATAIEKEEKTISIFEAIKKDDFRAFQCSFENGVDLSACNEDGFNPMTYATNFGNNAMVEYMLKHDADPSIKDRRGYNAFHTAVENQFKDICKILLDVNPDLIATRTSSGETVEQLADKHTFSKWIKNEISNAY